MVGGTPFLILAGLYIGKKTAVYLVARLYGFPKLYRKMMRVNRLINKNNPAQYNKIRDGVQYTFRIPNFMIDYFKSKNNTKPIIPRNEVKSS
jgi:hypothetical protein